MHCANSLIGEIKRDRPGGLRRAGTAGSADVGVNAGSATSAVAAEGTTSACRPVAGPPEAPRRSLLIAALIAILAVTPAHSQRTDLDRIRTDISNLRKRLDNVRRQAQSAARAAGGSRSRAWNPDAMSSSSRRARRRGSTGSASRRRRRSTSSFRASPGRKKTSASVWSPSTASEG